MKTSACKYAVIGVVLGLMFGALFSFTNIVNADGFGSDLEPEPVNYESFFNAFKNHADWNLEYKRYDYSNWTDGNAYLTIEKTWIDTLGFWKFNLILDVPVNIFSARFTFGVDLPVLDYVERVGQYEYYLNYSGYNCFFNWSDMASIPNIEFTHGIYESMFWFRFKRDNIPVGHYEFDPTFGFEGARTGLASIEDKIRGSPFLFTFNGSYANADNITAIFKTTAEQHNCTAGLYVNSTGVLIGQTEIKSINTVGAFESHIFNFTVPVNITAYNNTEILIVLTSNSSVASNCLIGTSSTSGLWRYDDDVFDGTLHDPFFENGINNSNICNIFCSYTITNATVNATVPIEHDTIDLGETTIIFIIWLVFAWCVLKSPDFYVILISLIIISLIAVLTYSAYDVFNFTLWLIVSFAISIIGIPRIIEYS